MRLVFPGVPFSLRSRLEAEVHASACALAEFEEVEVISQTDGLIFKHSGGFMYYKHPADHENDIDTFRAYVNDAKAREYMPITYEIDEDPEIPQKVLAEFEKKYGGSSQILWTIYREAGKKLLIMELPHRIVKAMFMPDGGRLMTSFRGRAGNLRKITTLKPAIPDEIEDDEVIHRAFASQYGPGGYEAAYSIHQRIMKHAVENPNLGICVGPIGVWSP